MFLVWVSRCMPGLSIIALLFLLVLSFPDVFSLPQWTGLFPQSPGRPSNNESNQLSLAQKIFIAYSIFIHLNMFGFTMRLSWALLGATKEAKQVLEARLWDAPRKLVENASRFADSPILHQEYPDPCISKDNVDGAHEEVVHAVIVPNYAEDIDTLAATLNVLASHPRAQSQYEVG